MANREWVISSKLQKLRRLPQPKKKEDIQDGTTWVRRVLEILLYWRIVELPPGVAHCAEICQRISSLGMLLDIPALRIPQLLDIDEVGFLKAKRTPDKCIRLQEINLDIFEFSVAEQSPRAPVAK